MPTPRTFEAANRAYKEASARQELIWNTLQGSPVGPEREHLFVRHAEAIDDRQRAFEALKILRRDRHPCQPARQRTRGPRSIRHRRMH